MTTIEGAVEVDAIDPGERPLFSICTLVTDKQQYSQMLTSFSSAGFSGSNSEFIYIDNTASNKYDAYAGINKFMRVVRGRYIIFCHQDILLHDDRIDRLEEVIAEMDAFDPTWAVLGNAGGVVPGRMVIRITDPPYGPNVTIGKLPAKVCSLDENFILLKADANLAVSHDIKGFHFYGTDLCLIADVLGYCAYVVDFHLHHIGGETIRNRRENRVDMSPMNFKAMKKVYIKKYRRAFRSRWIQSTCTIFHVSGSAFRNIWANWKIIISLQKRINRWFGEKSF